MSVVGIDVGTDTSVVAMARKRGIDVLLNKESKRETPAVVNFGDKMRFLGTDGLAKMGLAPQNTVFQLKRLLGRKFQHPGVQAALPSLPFSVTEALDGGCLINVQFQGERHSFTPEQLVAMVLFDCKQVAQAESGVPPVDCVLSVPDFYDEAQRSAMLDASKIAGLNCLRLINENTATALAYGIFKTDLPETEPVHVAFVDVGHSSTQASVVSLRRGGLQVKSHTWDENLGGLHFDELLFDHFCAEIKAKHKIDIKTNKKASFKLRVQCEKAKKILSANAEAQISCECIMDDVDVRGSINRETFEGMIAPQLVRLQAVLQQAITESGLTANDIASVEIVGSSTRIPAVARVVEEVFGKAPSRTMNAKECVARGCALQCAMLSPVFKVRDFEVIDACPYSVEFQWDKDGERTSQVLFERGSPFPSAKMLTFLRSEPFTITAVCKELGTTLGQYTIGPFAVPAGQEKAKLKVKVRMNLHGLTSVEQVQQIEEEEVQAAAAAGGDAPMTDANNAAAGSEAAAADANATGPAPMETDNAAEAEKAKAAAAAKKKVKKTDVPFQASAVAGYSQKQLDEYFEKEVAMEAADRLQEETADRKNAVEAYLYKLRNGLYAHLEPYVRQEEKDRILEQLQACEDWLYEDGEDCQKSVYVAKLEELKAFGEPVFQRHAEEEARPPAIAALRQAAQGYLAFASSSEARYAHITPEERATVAKEAEAALAWLNEKVSLQSGLAKHDPPVLLAADCTKKAHTLALVARPIVNKPAPKPAAPKPAPAPEAQQPAAAEESTTAPMESEGGSEGQAPAPEGGAAGEQQPMEP